MHFRFNGGHLEFQISVYIGQYWDYSSTELLDVENVAVAVEISLLS